MDEGNQQNRREFLKQAMATAAMPKGVAGKIAEALAGGAPVTLSLAMLQYLKAASSLKYPFSEPEDETSIPQTLACLKGFLHHKQSEYSSQKLLQENPELKEELNPLIHAVRAEDETITPSYRANSRKGDSHLEYIKEYMKKLHDKRSEIATKIGIPKLLQAGITQCSVHNFTTVNIELDASFILDSVDCYLAPLKRVIPLEEYGKFYQSQVKEFVGELQHVLDPQERAILQERADEYIKSNQEMVESAQKEIEEFRKNEKTQQEKNASAHRKIAEGYALNTSKAGVITGYGALFDKPTNFAEKIRAWRDETKAHNTQLE